jgi:hypothetical protein
VFALGIDELAAVCLLAQCQLHKRQRKPNGAVTENHGGNPPLPMESQNCVFFHAQNWRQFFGGYVLVDCVLCMRIHNAYLI